MSMLKSIKRILPRVKVLVAVLIVAAAAVPVAYVWTRHVSPTRIALVNFRDFQFAEMLDSEDPRAWVKLDRIDLPNLATTDLKRYDAAFFFGRGLNLDEPQQAMVRRAIAAGTRVYVHGATNAASDQASTKWRVRADWRPPNRSSSHGAAVTNPGDMVSPVRTAMGRISRMTAR